MCASDDLQVVHFPHPGGEFHVEGATATRHVDVRWNTSGRHFRRLVGHDGAYVDAAGKVKHGKLVFWTEWEAATSAIALDGAHDDFSARFLHEVKNPVTYPLKCRAWGCCTNTDPCVFGSTFKYSNCRQYRNRGLLSLRSGSLIIFGSRLKGEFVLDTVFVVDGDGKEYSASCELDVSEEYRSLTLSRIGGDLKADPFVFYRGAKPVERRGRPFSFTSARICSSSDTDLGRRCVIDVEALNSVAGATVLNINNTRAAAVRSFSGTVVEKIWGELKRQVLANGFVLGVHFDWPSR